VETNRADLARERISLRFGELVGLHLEQAQLELLQVARYPLRDWADEFAHAPHIPNIRLRNLPSQIVTRVHVTLAPKSS
jgi:hypothetical protein